MAMDLDTQRLDTAVHSTYPIHFHGRGGSLFGIQIVNLFLSLITFGIYSFWGRVKVRRYLASQTEFGGDRFAYHGTGQELMIGWAKAMVLFGIPLFVLAVLQVIVGMESDLFDVLQILIYIVVGIFIPVAMVNARRYRLSRLSWRGVRFSFRGGVRDFMAIYIKGWLLTVVSLGFYYPFWQTRRQTFMVAEFLLRQSEIRFRRPWPRSLLDFCFAYDPDPADVFSLLVLVLGAGTALLRRSYVVPGGALAFDGQRRRRVRFVVRQCDSLHSDLGSRLVMDHRAQHALLCQPSDDGRDSRMSQASCRKFRRRRRPVRDFPVFSISTSISAEQVRARQRCNCNGLAITSTGKAPIRRNARIYLEPEQSAH